MKRVFVHIGPHKTASTAIQKHFFERRAALRSDGVLYPESCWFHYGQHRLSFALKGMDDPTVGAVPDWDFELHALKSEILRSSAGSAFVSSEEFFSADRPAVERLRAGLAEFDVKIIAFLRRPDALLLSIYNQIIRTIENKLHQPLNGFVGNPQSLHADLDLEGHCTKWIEIFGIENTTLLLYEDDDPRRSVCRAIGIDSGPLAEERINTSLSNTAIEMIRIAKSLDADKEALQKLRRRAARFFPPDGRSALTHDERRAILAHYSDSLPRLLGRFGMESPYDPAQVDLGQENLAIPPSNSDLVAFALFLLGQRGQDKAGRRG